MPNYTIVFARSARKELESLPSSSVQRIFPKIEALASNPRPPGCKKLRGSQNLWRIRIGDYRIIYSVDDKKIVIDVIAVRHRSEAYD